MHNGKSKYDFKAFGQSIKEARESRGWTLERLAQEVDLVPRYIVGPNETLGFCHFDM